MFIKGSDGVTRQMEEVDTLSSDNRLAVFRKSESAVCTTPGCKTFLSMYNPLDLCSLCQRKEGI